MERKVLVSPGFGAGWSTWIHGGREQREFAMFDPALIAAIEANVDVDAAVADFMKRFEDRFNNSFYDGGADGLEVQTVDGPFIIDEYDGHESIQRRDETEWF